MMRNKTSSSLQKTYDECYLICSTAVYYEAQGNEAEALRSWRSALDQIYYHNAYRMPSNYRPKTETEKALYDSLKNMELQCKERVDLLEALKQSRQENEGSDDTKKGESKGSKPSSFLKPSSSSKTAESSNAQRGYIGDGTIPAVSYPDISRPPALPTRPSYTSRNSSEYAVVGKQTPRTSIDLPSSSRPAVPSPPVHHGPTEKPSRSTSPDKTRTFRTTLRSGDRREKKSTSASSASSSRPRDAVGSKAATLAWTALGKTKDTSSTTSASDPRNLVTDHSRDVRFDIHTRRLVNGSPSPSSLVTSDETLAKGKSSSHTSLPIGTPPAEGSTASTPAIQIDDLTESTTSEKDTKTVKRKPVAKSVSPRPIAPVAYPSYLKEYPQSSAQRLKVEQAIASMDRRSSSSKDVDSESSASKLSRRPMANSSSPRARDRHRIRSDDSRSPRRAKKISDADASSQSADEDSSSALERPARPHRKPPKPKPKKKELVLAHSAPPPGEPDEGVDLSPEETEWKKKVAYLMKHLPRGVDEEAAKQIINEIVVQGDEVHWDDVAGLEIAKTALKETVVYPFLRPDLFMGLREPARGMLLFGPPGTGKTMLARAVATESKSTFFSISASSLTSKYLGESEKLVRALFAVAKVLAPSIIFVDEIDSLLSSRSGSGEHEATRRIKTEFLIQWSDLQRAAAGREQNDKDKERGDASRVLVLAATNLPWAIDEAARRRFVRRQYIPLPEDVTRAKQLSNLLGHQKHRLSQDDFSELVRLTEGFSGSDITALAKDAAMGPLRSLGDKLLTTNMSDIRPMQLSDFKASLLTIRPSVSKQGLKEFEDWAKEFGERGG